MTVVTTEDDPEISFRKIEPYTLISTNRKWILIAWCYLREDYRSFRVDRIRHFKVTNEAFEDRGFNLQTYFKITQPFVLLTCTAITSK